MPMSCSVNLVSAVKSTKLHSVVVSNTSLGTSRSAYRRMAQKLTKLPRSSNKSMWRFLLRKHFVNFGNNFYTVPEFASTLLFSKRLVAAN